MRVPFNATGRRDMAISFEALASLPTAGPLHENFSSSRCGMHSEGFVVRFHSDITGTWVGNFQRGPSGISDVRLHPNGTHVIVVAGGDGYVIDVETKRALSTFGGMISHILPIPGTSDLIFAEEVWLERFGVNGTVWQSERISWDGFRAVKIEAGWVSGEAYTPLGDRWTRFSVRLSNGSVEGGSCNESELHRR